MARQTKRGLDYFSHDVTMFNDPKIKIIKAKHGLIGYAIYIRLLELIYDEHGYYINIDEDFNILFVDDNNIDLNVYINVLNDCIERGLFCSKIYKKYNVLTSERIQKNYMDATIRRQSVDMAKEYLMVNADILNDNVNINSLNVDNGTQRKGKESKVNKTNGYTIEFESLYKLYPRAENKAQTYINYNNLLKKYSVQELTTCVKRYTKKTKEDKTDKQYITSSSNFFGKKAVYVDFLDINYISKNNGESIINRDAPTVEVKNEVHT